MANAVKKEVIELSDFFTLKNEEDGVWVEPILFNGKLRVGFQFQILGANSSKLSMVTDEFNRKMSEVEAMVDGADKEMERNKIYIENSAKRITGIRAVSGKELTLNGKPFEYSIGNIEKLLMECPELAVFVIRYSTDSSNFMNKKFV